MQACLGRLPFTVQSCSGEDPEHPATELLYNGASSRGWQSARNSPYPQEIILKLEQPALLTQIQLLSHEYKIPTKIELIVGNPVGDNGSEELTWKKLGYLSFDSNERSGYQARELKSVHVNVRASYLRLVPHQCHLNKKNVYNQVGIVAVNLVGEPVSLNTSAKVDHVASAARQITATISKDSAQNQPNVDEITAAKIQEIQVLKEAAVEKEDYDEAKRLKITVDKLKSLGVKIAELEAKKQNAVKEEDYDLAKSLKAQIERMRAAPEYQSATNFHDFVPETENVVRAVQHTGQNGSILAPKPVPSSRSFGEEPSDAELTPQRTDNYAVLESKPSFQDRNEVYDERPVKARGTYSFTESDLEQQDPVGNQARPNPQQNKAPDNFPSDLPAPEPLSAAHAKDSEPLVPLVGEYTVRCIFSKTWQLREAGLQHVEKLIISDQLTAEPRETYRLLLRLVGSCIKDKVANVFQAALNLLKVMIDTYILLCPKDVTNSLSDWLPVFIEKACDSNTRTKESATALILYLAAIKEVGLSNHAALFIKPVKNQNAWKVVLGRLQLVYTLLPILNVQSSPEAFQLEPLMRFVGAAFASANAEVRAMAVKVAAEVIKLIGPAVYKQLPADLNPKIREQIEQAVVGESPTVASGLPQSFTPVGRKNSSSHDRQPDENAPPHSARSARSSSRGHGDSLEAGDGHRRGSTDPEKYQRPVKTPVATGAPPVPLLALHEAQADAPSESQRYSYDDPALFEAAIATKERALGPDHPDVAEAVANLALLYSQRQNYEAAQPLYERALYILEKAFGANHPNVAHALTDLAVLHLEQGNESIGRPLLERALRIQETALGPNHSDVVAIRDVLFGDDA